MKRNSSSFKWRHYAPNVITAERTLEGIESMNMTRKGQVKRLDARDAVRPAKFVASLFGIAACGKAREELFRLKFIFATQPDPDEQG
jgi:hypothetical protein